MTGHIVSCNERNPRNRQTRCARQQSDVAGAQPDVVARLKAFYDNWWAELEPTFKRIPSIYLGHEKESPVRLTSHDWIVDGSTPWNQPLVRLAVDKPLSTGYWNVKVVTAGEYEIRLRRWPEEADTAIGAPLPPGADVPGDSPFRASPGKTVAAVKALVRIGEPTAEASVGPGAKEVVLRMTLPNGQARMTALFTSQDGGIVGAYYAYVKKL